MADIITTLHPEEDENTNLYPNIKKENIPNGSIDTSKLSDDVNSTLNAIPQAIATITQPAYYTTLPTTDVGLIVYSDGYLYKWNGTQYVTTGILYLSTGNLFMYSQLTGSFDFSNLATNTIYNICGSNASNAPSEYNSSGNYTLIDLEVMTQVGLLRRQILFDNLGRIYQRFKYQGNWQSWKTTSIVKANTTTNVDFNSLPTNTISNILIVSGTVSNAPSDFNISSNYTLIDIENTTGYGTVRTQTLVKVNGKVYYRSQINGTWYDWNESTLTINNTTTSVDFNSLSTNTVSNILIGSGTVSNAPSDFSLSSNYTLIDITTKVGAFSSLRRQILTNAKAIYQRNYTSQYGWSAWNKNTSLEFNPSTAQELIDMIAIAIQTPNSIVNLNGTYDLSSILTTDITLENGVKLIGSGNSKIIFNYTGSDISFMSNVSPFKKGGNGGFTLENITIEASKCRYCVHDEDTANTDVYHNKYINCNFYLDNSESTAWSNFMQCIGGGLGANGTIEVINCKFHSIPQSSYTGVDLCDVSYHNSSNSSAQSKLFISNSYFENTFRLSWYGESTAITKCMINNCSMDKAIIHRAENSSANVENTELIAWCNEIRS